MDNYNYTWEQNNKLIINLIYQSIISEGGDGDALWLSKHTSLEQLIEDIEYFNKKYNTGWKIEKHKDYFSWGNEQEWALITDSKDFFNAQPNWIILKIDF